MKHFYNCLLLLISPFYIKAQSSLPSYFFDESSLALESQTSIVSDPTANGGNAIRRLATSSNNAMWYGPYTSMKGGDYLVQVRLKTSNGSSASVFFIDVVSHSGNITYASLDIKPSMFKESGKWQLFTLPVQLPEGIADYEVRGVGFQTGVADIYLDYINIIPGGITGTTSSDFTINSKGDVGIGTTTPSETLSVKGKIRAKEIKVELSGWPDYVFAKEHKLPQLKDIESFIKKNQHLPEVPSAQEVKDNGLSLGEMHARLLKKIEELTLYLIEQNKKIEALQQHVMQLRKAN